MRLFVFLITMLALYPLYSRVLASDHGTWNEQTQRWEGTDGSYFNYDTNRWELDHNGEKWYEDESGKYQPYNQKNSQNKNKEWTNPNGSLKNTLSEAMKGYRQEHPESNIEDDQEDTDWDDEEPAQAKPVQKPAANKDKSSEKKKSKESSKSKVKKPLMATLNDEYDNAQENEMFYEQNYNHDDYGQMNSASVDSKNKSKRKREEIEDDDYISEDEYQQPKKKTKSQHLKDRSSLLSRFGNGVKAVGKGFKNFLEENVTEENVTGLLNTGKGIYDIASGRSPSKLSRLTEPSMLDIIPGVSPLKEGIRNKAYQVQGDFQKRECMVNFPETLLNTVSSPEQAFQYYENALNQCGNYPDSLNNFLKSYYQKGFFTGTAPIKLNDPNVLKILVEISNSNLRLNILGGTAPETGLLMLDPQGQYTTSDLFIHSQAPLEDVSMMQTFNLPIVWR